MQLFDCLLLHIENASFFIHLDATTSTFRINFIWKDHCASGVVMLCSTKIRVVKEIEELSKEEMLLYSATAALLNSAQRYFAK